MTAKIEVMYLMVIHSATKLPLMCSSLLQSSPRKTNLKQKVRKDRTKQKQQLKKRPQKGRKLIQQVYSLNSKSTFTLIQSSLSEEMTNN